MGRFCNVLPPSEWTLAAFQQLFRAHNLRSYACLGRVDMCRFVRMQTTLSRYPALTFQAGRF